MGSPVTCEWDVFLAEDGAVAASRPHLLGPALSVLHYRLLLSVAHRVAAAVCDEVAHASSPMWDVAVQARGTNAVPSVVVSWDGDPELALAVLRQAVREVLEPRRFGDSCVRCEAPLPTGARACPSCGVRRAAPRGGYPKEDK